MFAELLAALEGTQRALRPSTNKIIYRPTFRVELAHDCTVLAPPPEPAERTMVIRAQRTTRTARAAVLATLFAIATLLTTLL